MLMSLIFSVTAFINSYKVSNRIKSNPRLGYPFHNNHDYSNSNSKSRYNKYSRSNSKRISSSSCSSLCAMTESNQYDYKQDSYNSNNKGGADKTPRNLKKARGGSYAESALGGKYVCVCI